ncbi:16S rRNA (guanine(1207)-N(2))-methyltransferase RsmC [Enterobacteriaceae endosymbiont of Donacia tomentosa]|uniref:16S rRNA (guanine(1207)-N(2))-methyltransferase RsmC n=1 Tax=Enterobacteriaceae endosymbiont of Donacia tomentosa TaxID=2675787 RepID=UPI001449C72C|nr:16S rRNA (guanine(1207)-N(2))-methyltransferase RsmC [Enterobacteriaceae endosymbiont of Donacia tomentosa]QJC31606.1 16S rRNA (guanine(1207)-N(2))-methyltransferase RsmC [Enterobacteriaceae endosymbiont of Donacia tomentosa]
MYKLLPINKYFLCKFKNKFINRKVIFAGNINDKIPIYLNTLTSFVNTHKYDYYLWLKKIIGEKIYYGLLNSNFKNYNFNVLIFFWLKNKRESVFLLKNILSILTLNSDIFIIGENNSGIKQINNIIELDIVFNKIICARKSIIFHSFYKKNIIFNKENYWNFYFYKNYKIYNLPGVFSGNKLDNGSKLLISTLDFKVKGKILDLGCGAGVISTVIGRENILNNGKNVILSTDIDYKAINSTKKTLHKNNIQNSYVISSDVFSNINEKFDFIISNPPIHDGKKISLKVIYKILKSIKKYLKYNGEFRFVTNNSVSYSKIFTKLMYKFCIICRNKNFSVYSIKNK